MKFFIPIILVILYSCGDHQHINNNVDISTALNLNVSVDRLIEIETNKQKSEALKKEINNLRISTQYARSFNVKTNNKTQFLDLLKREEQNLLFGNSESICSLDKDTVSYFYLKNNKSTFPLNHFVTSIHADSSDLVLNLDSLGVDQLRNFVLKNINQTLLLEIDGQLITAADALGNFKNGLLVLKNVNKEVLQNFKN